MRAARPAGSRPAVLALVVASFWSLDLQWAQFLSLDAARSMGRFLGEFFPPDTSPDFLRKVALGTWETLAMSALGTLLAAAAGLAAGPAGQPPARCRPARARAPRGWLLNALRAIPELVWAALLLIAAGLGPFAGTLALACTPPACWAGCLPRRWKTPRPARRLRCARRAWAQGRVFLYATLPQVLPQLMSYTLYRWENNIRAAAVLGVVGAGGLGQLLAFHMGLFHMGKTATMLGAMLLLVALVDALSYASAALDDRAGRPRRSTTASRVVAFMRGGVLSTQCRRSTHEAGFRRAATQPAAG
jgi:phosphonate transport system permease protein